MKFLLAIVSQFIFLFTIAQSAEKQIGQTVIDADGIYIAVTYPNSLDSVNNIITIEASMTNRSDYSVRGGLTLSFPQLVMDAGNVVYSSFDSAKGYPLYSLIYNQGAHNNTPSQYYMVEGWAENWAFGLTKRMAIELKLPQDFSHTSLKVKVRGVVIKSDTTRVTVPSEGTLDQQEYQTKEFEISLQ